MQRYVIPVALSALCMLGVSARAQQPAVRRADTLGANFDHMKAGTGTPNDFDYLIGTWEYTFRTRKRPSPGEYEPARPRAAIFLGAEMARAIARMKFEGSRSPLPSLRPQCLRRLHPQRSERGHDTGERADTDHQHRVPDQQRGVAERQHADPGPLELR